ncbi:hypothetical protein [Pedobacter antarcticus]|uniref:hypothetical protein n=1 Tax=Pedobacter antarcticus TaxID=34086 RepID=UPI00088127BA|nr:hypothetical protein [Pedobacter antarcticus]SDM39763.1 hypothetical protein SAMN04488084_106145 [Pedobacter antarcticus]
MQSPLLNYINTNKTDAVIFKSTELFKLAGGDPFAEDLVLGKISDMISMFESDLLKESYIAKISKQIKVKANIISKLVKRDSDKKQEESIQHVPEGMKALPKWINKDKFYTVGFDSRNDDQENTGIYFAMSGNEARRLTNFALKPIVHIKSDDAESNRRLTEIDNGYVKEVIELPSKAWSSADMFENILLDKGVFMTFDGFSKSHLNKLKAVFLHQYVVCRELNKLGWQKEGFFAFSNVIYKDNIIKYDEYGVAEVDGTNYISMSASNALAGYSDSEDDYKNDKYLKYVKTDLSFSKWSGYMTKVYGASGMMGVCYALIACFKDIIFKRNNNCPLPYAWGPAGSGKSKFAESCASVFLHDMPAFNLNNGTDFALAQRLERFYNVIQLFNEFDEATLPEHRTRTFKGAFDGEGREKGSGRKGKSKTQEINCLAMLLGQFLTTSDDGSILQRTLPEKFTENNNRTDEQVRLYDELKDYEKKGITSISCEIMSHRSYVSQVYVERFNENVKQIKNTLAKDGIVVKNRIIENYANAYTMVDIISDKITLEFSSADFYKHCIKQIISLSTIVSESNALSEFWNIVEFLLSKDFIEQGFDYKVETLSAVKIGAGRGQETTKTFSEPKKLLFLRFNTVHNLYLKEKKIQTGKTGLNPETVMTYMRDQESYIGNNPSGKFRSKTGKQTNTSSFVFDYDKLNVNLDMLGDKEPDAEPINITGKIYGAPTMAEVLGAIKIKFTLIQDESYFKDGQSIEKIVYTTCYFRDVDEFKNLSADQTVKINGILQIRKSRAMEVLSVTHIKQTDLPF